MYWIVAENYELVNLAQSEKIYIEKGISGWAIISENRGCYSRLATLPTEEKAQEWLGRLFKELYEKQQGA